LLAGVVLSISALIAFLPQVGVWHYYTGEFRPVQVEPLRWSTPFILVALFSTRGGLFPWSPIAYASTLGLFFSGRFSPATKRLTWWVTVFFLLEIYVGASAGVVPSGYAYGARRLTDGGVILGLGAALLWDAVAERRRQWVAAFAALCVVLNLVAMELVRTP